MWFFSVVQAVRLACLVMISGAEGFNFEMGPESAASEPPGGMYSCLETGSCTREDLAKASSPWPQGSPGSGFHVANKLFGYTSWGGAENELMAVLKNNEGLAASQKANAHDEFQELEFRALQDGKMRKGSFGNKITDHLADVPPKVRAPLSAMLSKTRDADSRLWDFADRLWNEDVKPFFHKAGAAVELMDEL